MDRCTLKLLKQFVFYQAIKHVATPSVLNLIKHSCSFINQTVTEYGLAWFILLYSTVCVITVVKMWTREAHPNESTAANFDHCVLRHIGALTIYTIHPGGNFRCKYSVLKLFQTQNGKIRKCISINWKVQKERKMH